MLKKIKGEKYVQIGEKRGNRFFKSEMLSLDPINYDKSFMELMDNVGNNYKRLELPKITVWDVITGKANKKTVIDRIICVGNFKAALENTIRSMINDDKPGKKL